MIDEKHIHTEECSCGCEHEHHHEHSENAERSHEHHHHDEHCGCGCEDEHHHEHEEHCNCSACSGHAAPDEPGKVYVGVANHDSAVVVSGRLTVSGKYEEIKQKLSDSLTALAAEIAGRGGIVGHIKASCEVKSTDMLSVTDYTVMVKSAPVQEIKITLASIVFLIDNDKALELCKWALEKVNL